jgi:hypothetical protein
MDRPVVRRPWMRGQDVIELRWRVGAAGHVRRQLLAYSDRGVVRGYLRQGLAACLLFAESQRLHVELPGPGFDDGVLCADRLGRASMPRSGRAYVLRWRRAIWRPVRPRTSGTPGVPQRRQFHHDTHRAGRRAPPRNGRQRAGRRPPRRNGRGCAGQRVSRHSAPTRQRTHGVFGIRERSGWIGDDPRVQHVLPGRREQRLASRLFGVDLHLHLQRRAALHLRDDGCKRLVHLVLPWDELRDDSLS